MVNFLQRVYDSGPHRFDTRRLCLLLYVTSTDRTTVSEDIMTLSEMHLEV